MIVLLVGSYHKINTNDYIKYVADAYQQAKVQVFFEEQNFLYSNVIPDIVHIQWPESIYKWKRLVTMDSHGFETIKQKLHWYKKQGTTIIHTVHNEIPHDNVIEFDRNIYNLIFEYADILIHHGKSSINIIKERYPQTLHAKHIVAPHGPYQKNTLPDPVESKLKYNLPLDKLIITNFGKQRSYKGINFINELFRTWNNNKICLLNIGELRGGTAPLDEKSSEDFKIVNIYRNIPEDEIPQMISASDAFFLGHTSGLNSGLLPLAITYKKPIVFPDIGNFKEQAKGWDFYETYTANNPLSAIKALATMEKKLQLSSDLCNKEWHKLNSWKLHVKNILTAYNQLKGKK